MKFDAKVTISRTSGGGDQDHPISITIEDDSSGCELVEVRMTLADFAAAVTGCGCLPALGEFRPGCPVGKRREVKQEVVTVPEGWELSGKDGDRATRAAPVLAPYEVDGWEGHVGDLFNSHRWVGGTNKYRVTFTRFVDASDSPATRPAAEGRQEP